MTTYDTHLLLFGFGLIETFAPENQYFQIDHNDCCSTFGKSKKEFDYEFRGGAGESTKNASSKAKETR